MDSALNALIDQVRAAAAGAGPLRICGAGSKDFHGGPCGGQILDTRPLSGIVSYQPSELVITARAGTPLAEIDAALSERGQCLPFEPPHRLHPAVPDSPGATVGGMVAAGWSGPARANVGAVRDYVLGAHLINGRAEHLQFGGQVMKNVAGYDVSRLMVGAWGTLGVLTQLSLKVLPVPPGDATLRFACNQADALRKLHAWGGQPLPLNASCWLPDDGGPGTGQLWVRLRGAQAAVRAACRSMGGEVVDALVAQPLWADCREQRLPWFGAWRHQPGQALWRLSVPATAPVLQLPGRTSVLMEWHGALRWVQAPVQAGAALHEAAQAVGGSASLFIANNEANTPTPSRFGLKSPVLIQLHARIKASFDPAGIFNPGRMGMHG